MRNKRGAKIKLITDAELKQDLEGFYDRLEATRDKLAALPTEYLPYPQHKRREQKRRVYEDEIAHVKRLIAIAEEALTTESV